MSLSTKQKWTHRYRGQACGCQGLGEGKEMYVLGVWDGQMQLLHLRWINNKVLPIAQETRSNLLGDNKMEKNIKRMYIFL